MIDELAEFREGGFVCQHLLEPQHGYDVYYQFTGVGVAYNLLCNQCYKNIENTPNMLRKITPEQFYEIDDCWHKGFIGQPEILSRPVELRFTHEVIVLPELPSDAILSIQALANGQWIALQKSGAIVQIDFSKRSVRLLFQVTPNDLELSDKMTLHLSPDTHFAAVVNTFGQFGVVIDLTAGRKTMLLNRGDYHPEQTHFPIAFFSTNGHSLLIHNTDWNRLDISDPQSGECLTERAFEKRPDQRYPDHYLDYFHGRLLISPNQQSIAEDGWVWHPVGAMRTWDLQQWLQHNRYESEDGQSLKNLVWRSYFWNGPFCWIDNTTLAVWGFGNDDDWLIPAILLFDVTTGRRIKWFTGTQQGTLFFDKYLFSVSTTATEIWEIETGERLQTEVGFTPVNFHPQTHQFLSLLSDNSFQLSRLLNQ